MGLVGDFMTKWAIIFIFLKKPLETLETRGLTHSSHQTIVGFDVPQAQNLKSALEGVQAHLLGGHQFAVAVIHQASHNGVKQPTFKSS